MSQLTLISNNTLADADVVMGNFNNLEGRIVPTELFAQNTAGCTGLTWAFNAGRLRRPDGVVVAVAAGSVTLTASVTNYVQIDAAGAVSVATTRALDKKSIRQLVTDTGSVIGGFSSATNNVDERTGFDFLTPTVTVDQSVVPSSNTGLVATLLNNIANLLKGITGKADWKTAPATTLEACNTHINNTANPHGVTAAQAGAVPTTRTVSTSARLAGGGDLSADRTLDLATSGVTAGTFTTVDGKTVTVDVYGRITSIV